MENQYQVCCYTTGQTLSPLPLYLLSLSLSIPHSHSLSLSLGNHDVYRLQAGSEEERDQWIHSIAATISQGTAYDAFQQRKRQITSVQGLELPGL